MYYERKMSASMREQRRLACALELKSIDGQGRFAGYASVFGVLDHQKDIILRGAFADTINGRVPQIKLLWQHQPDEPIGIFTTMFEDGRGLYVEGQLLLTVARAREALALLKSGAVNGLSIGYSPVRYTIEPDGVRKLWEVDLWEVSLVTFPANDQAGVTVVKSASKKNTLMAMRQLSRATQRAIGTVAQVPVAALPDGDDDEALLAAIHASQLECERIRAHALLLEIKAYTDITLKFSPGEPRDDHGRWTSEGGDPVSGTGMQVAENNTIATDTPLGSGKLPTQNVGNVIFNETRSLSSTPQADINDARIDIAHMIRNGEDWGSTYGINRPRTADDFISGNIPDLEMHTYNDAQAAAASADAQIAQGIDPTNGAIYMSIVGDGHTILNGKTLTLSTGPFKNSFTLGDVPYKTVYINFSE